MCSVFFFIFYFYACVACVPPSREYALLAVRNLCEGNPANQASIAGLQPQGCTPGMEEALADMGLAGRVDSQGKFRVDPLPPGN